jgi:hypothetical protein
MSGERYKPTGASSFVITFISVWSHIKMFCLFQPYRAIKTTSTQNVLESFLHFNIFFLSDI